MEFSNQLEKVRVFDGRRLTIIELLVNIHYLSFLPRLLNHSNTEEKVIDYDCACGNPDCHAKIMFRKGSVFFSDPDGKQRQVVGWLHIEATDGYDEKTGNLKYIELMLEPYQARHLMWTMICCYMPVFHRIYSFCFYWFFFFPQQQFALVKRKNQRRSKSETS